MDLSVSVYAVLQGAALAFCVQKGVLCLAEVGRGVGVVRRYRERGKGPQWVVKERERGRIKKETQTARIQWPPYSTRQRQYKSLLCSYYVVHGHACSGVLPLASLTTEDFFFRFFFSSAASVLYLQCSL